MHGQQFMAIVCLRREYISLKLNLIVTLMYFKGSFGLQNSKYWTKQYKTEQHNTR